MQKILHRNRFPFFILFVLFFASASCGCASAFSRHVDEARGYIGEADSAMLSGDGKRGQELYGKAMESLTRAEKIGVNEPELPAVFFMQGYIEERRGNPKKALEKMAKAVELEPENADFHAKLGYQLCGVGEQEVFEGDKARGREWLKEGKKHIERAVELDPKQGMARLLLAQALYAEGNIKLARENIRKGIQLMLEGEGGEVPPIERMALIYAQMAELAGHAGDNEISEHYYRLAYETNPTERRHLGDYVRVLVLRASGKTENLEKARKLLKNALDADPNAGGLLDILGVVYFYLRRNQEGIEALERAHSMNALSFEGHRALARLYSFLKRDQDALGLLENYLDDLKNAGQKERAAIIAENIARAIIAGSSSVNQSGEIGEIDAINGTRAVKALKAGLEVSPGNIELLHACSFTYLLMRRITEAKKIADRIIAEGGELAYYGHTLYVAIHKLNGDTAKAIESAMDAIEADPTLVQFYVEVAKLSRDKPDEAMEILELGLKVNPDNPMLLDELVQVSLEKHDYESAGRYAERLVEKLPKNFIGYFYRSLVALAKGEAEASSKALNDAMALAPTDEARALISADWSRIREQIMDAAIRSRGYPGAGAYESLKTEEREKYIVMAMQFPTPEGLEFIKIALGDNDAIIRTRAVEGLAFYNSSEVEPYVKAALKDPSDKVRGIAARILEKLELPGRLEMLVGLLDDPSSYVREISVKALRGLTGRNFHYDHNADAASRAKAGERWKKYVAESGK